MGRLVWLGMEPTRGPQPSPIRAGIHVVKGLLAGTPLVVHEPVVKLAAPQLTRVARLLRPLVLKLVQQESSKQCLLAADLPSEVTRITSGLGNDEVNRVVRRRNSPA